MFRTARKAENVSYFVLGQRDFNAGLGFRKEYETWNRDNQSEYEQGRLDRAKILRVNTATTKLAVA